eukprot:UN32579
MPFCCSRAIYCGEMLSFGMWGTCLNSLTHVLLYFHYLVTSLGIQNPFRRYLTKWQLGQFVVLLCRAVAVFMFIPVLRLGALQEMVYQVLMFSMFYAFYLTAYSKKKKGNALAGKARYKNDLPADQKKEIKLYGKYYDVSKFYKEHPGGKVIRFYTDRKQDASEPYASFHKGSKKANAILEDLPTRPIRDQAKAVGVNPEVIRHFRNLKAKWKQAGLYTTNYVYEFGYFFVILCMYKLAHMVLPHSMFLAGFIGGCAAAHVGFLQHNFGHMEVFESRPTNEFFQLILETY